MPIIQFSSRAAHQQIEIPDEIVTTKRVKREGKRAKKVQETKKIERLVKGSLHVRPGQTRVITTAELGWLRANTEHKRLFTVLREKDPPKKEPAVEPDAPSGSPDANDDDDESEPEF